MTTLGLRDLGFLAGNAEIPVFLDLYPGAIAAYSLRSLSSGSSSVIRVRRSSDNTEQDFTATQITDGTLAAFCGSGIGFVRTWYDQTLNANHAIMTTNELQPIIFNSGSLVTQGSRPALLFPSAKVFHAGTGLAGRARLDSYIVKNTTDTSYIFVSSSDANIYGPACDSILTGSSTTLSSNYGAPSFYANGTLFSGTTRTQLQSFYNGYKIEVHENASTLSWPNFDIGLYARQSNNLWYEGTLQEAVFYANNQSVNRILMQNSINSYYSVY